MVHRVIEAYDSWWSLLFEILCAWRRLMCAKQIISLVISFFFQICSPRRLPRKSSVAVDDLHGSLMVNTEVSFAIDF